MITVISEVKIINKTYLILNCEICKNNFNRLKTWVNFKIKNTNIQTICCSRECTNKAKFKQVEVVCKYCNELQYKAPCMAKRGKFSFCSLRCRTKYYNIHKTWGSIRSKLERFIENKIKSEFININVICNDRKTIGSELDFYFPDLNCAFQINGITHYKPIYGLEKFQRIKTLDKKKKKLCKTNNIKLVIINSSEDKKDCIITNEMHWGKIRKILQSYNNCVSIAQ